MSHDQEDQVEPGEEAKIMEMKHWSYEDQGLHEAPSSERGIHWRDSIWEPFQMPWCRSRNAKWGSPTNLDTERLIPHG